MNTIIITKILLEISVKIWKMLENIVDILCVNFKPNRKVAPFQINTYLDDEAQQQQQQVCVVWSKKIAAWAASLETAGHRLRKK